MLSKQSGDRTLRGRSVRMSEWPIPFPLRGNPLVRAIKLLAGEGGAVGALVVFLAWAGRLEPAVVRARERLLTQPTRSDWGARWAVLYLASGRREPTALRETVTWLQPAVGRQPDEVVLRYWLAIALAEVGEPEEALAEVSAALRIAPDLVELWEVKASLLLAAGRWKEALPSLDAALAGRTQVRLLWNGRRLALDGLGRPDGAVRSL